MTLIFDETNIEQTFNCKVFPISNDFAPVRTSTTEIIPGRNGLLLIDGLRHENVEMSYTAVFYSGNVMINLQNFKQFLLSKVGYKRLEDSFHPDEFYQAYVSADLDPVFTPDRTKAKVVFTFNRKPQRFLISGEITTTLTASGSITNPTLYASKPLLRVYGTGVLGIGSQSITITAVSGSYTDIDCEMQDAFVGAVNRNQYIQLSDYNFPTFAPGVNNISLGSGITRVIITPRWWRI